MMMMMMMMMMIAIGSSYNCDSLVIMAMAIYL